MTLKLSFLPCSTSPFVYSPYTQLYCSAPFPQYFRIRRLHKPPSSSLSATSPNPNTSASLSSPPIFLPFLQQNEQGEEEEYPIDDNSNSIGNPIDEFDSIEDPILRFFKSRSIAPDPDPTREGKLSLKKNRRTTWHLAPNIDDDDAVVSRKLQLEPKIQQLTPTNHQPDCPAADSVVGQILQLAKNLPENLTIGEVLGPYEGKLGEKECLEVLGLMGEDKDLVLSSLYFFEWMGLQEPSLITARACSVLFPVLGRAGMGDTLMILFKNLPNDVHFRDVHVYNAAISGLLCCERYDDAWRVFEKMEKDNVLPDNVTCSVLITIMRKRGNSAKDAWDFFMRMNRKGVKWSVEVVGALIKSFCEEGLQKEALVIQSEMEKKGIASNVVVYNTLMDAYSKSNRVEEAEGLFAEMKDKGIAPTDATYNILMDAYSRRMEPEIIEKLLVEMRGAGLEPNVKSYTCLISAYGRQKNMSDMAADAFLKMKRVGIRPTSHSYTALIHAYSVDGWHEKAYIAFENMLKEGIKPAIETYTALLDAFRRSGDTKTLMRIWKMMIHDKIEGTRVTFNILVDGFAKQGHYMEARDVICEFGKIGLQPTVMTYNMLMNAYARGGQDSKLPQLLNEMENLNLKPDSVTYSTMIYAFVRVRDFKRAFFYHKQMVKSGQLPDAKSYEKLRAILEVKAAIKNRKDKSAILGIINSKMGRVKIKKKGKKDEFWKYKKSSRPRGSERVGS